MIVDILNERCWVIVYRAYRLLDILNTVTSWGAYASKINAAKHSELLIFTFWCTSFCGDVL